LSRFEDIFSLLSDEELNCLLSNPFISQQVEIAAKYGGYIEQQLQEVEAFKREEASPIPEAIDYQKIHSLSSEGREKLIAVQPQSLGQAARISGVSRADLSILRLYMK
jgi:tRNA uridine 5-carboxymethylaminomethyl modification enzyme